MLLLVLGVGSSGSDTGELVLPVGAATPVGCWLDISWLLVEGVEPSATGMQEFAVVIDSAGLEVVGNLVCSAVELEIGGVVVAGSVVSDTVGYSAFDCPALLLRIQFVCPFPSAFPPA